MKISNINNAPATYDEIEIYVTKDLSLTMNTDRIKEIQQETAYPDSISVQQALLKVWNETEHSLKKDIYDTEVFIAVDNLNEKYITEEMEKEGLAFCLHYYTYGYSISFGGNDIIFWDSENEVRKYDDEADKYTESIFEFVEKEYLRFKKIIRE